MKNSMFALRLLAVPTIVAVVSWNIALALLSARISIGIGNSDHMMPLSIREWLALVRIFTLGRPAKVG